MIKLVVMKMKNDLYVLAHEMKNPLCVASGYLEMLNSENISKYKAIIKEEINNSLEILNNYMEYNKLIINREEIDLNVLLTDIKKSMKEYLTSKGINLKIDFYDDDIYLQADYHKLKQVFYNIIKNSIESKSKNIHISYQTLFGKIRIKIKNDGEKIMEDDLDKIGNNFSSKVLGNGIGTTLSKKIIEMHHGKIKYQNNKKYGISVIMTLSLS